jgi:hypothetical protein
MSESIARSTPEKSYAMPLKSEVESYYKDLRFPLRVRVSENVYLEEYWYYESYIGGVHLDDEYERIFITTGVMGLVY